MRSLIQGSYSLGKISVGAGNNVTFYEENVKKKYIGIMGSVVTYKKKPGDFISLQYKRHQVQCNQSGFVTWGVRHMNVILNDWSRTT